MQTIVLTSQSTALARTEPVICTNILEFDLLHPVRLTILICFYLLLTGHICLLKIGIPITGFSSSFSYGTIRYTSDRWHCFLHSALWVEANETDSGGATCLHHGKFFHQSQGFFTGPEQAKFKWSGQSMCTMHTKSASARGVWGHASPTPQEIFGILDVLRLILRPVGRIF